MAESMGWPTDGQIERAAQAAFDEVIGAYGHEWARQTEALHQEWRGMIRAAAPFLQSEPPHSEAVPPTEGEVKRSATTSFGRLKTIEEQLNDLRKFLIDRQDYNAKWIPLHIREGYLLAAEERRKEVELVGGWIAGIDALLADLPAQPANVEGGIPVRVAGGVRVSCGVHRKLLIVPEGTPGIVATANALRVAADVFHARRKHGAGWPVDECDNPICVRVMDIVRQLSKPIVRGA